MNDITLKAIAEELEKNAGLAEKLKGLDWNAARHAFVEEVGPASGAILGATAAGAFGKSPLSGAALGYGVGSLPEMILGGKGKDVAKHLTTKSAAPTPVGTIMEAAHHGVGPDLLSKMPAFKQLKNITRAGNSDAAKRIGGNISEFLKSRPQG